MCMNKIYSKALKRKTTLFDVKAWYEGESKELEKWLGFGFYNHIFHVENGIMTLYYDIEEGDKFWEILREKLTEEFFDELCDNFLELYEKSNKVDDKKELYDIYVKAWPALSIFDEISKYPELANERIINRLMRVRKTTESFAFDLQKEINEYNLNNYIYFKGEIIEKPFRDFINENEIEIHD